MFTIGIISFMVCPINALGICMVDMEHLLYGNLILLKYHVERFLLTAHTLQIQLNLKTLVHLMWYLSLEFLGVLLCHSDFILSPQRLL